MDVTGQSPGNIVACPFCGTSAKVIRLAERDADVPSDTTWDDVESSIVTKSVPAPPTILPPTAARDRWAAESLPCPECGQPLNISNRGAGDRVVCEYCRQPAKLSQTLEKVPRKIHVVCPDCGVAIEPDPARRDDVERFCKSCLGFVDVPRGGFVAKTRQVTAEVVNPHHSNRSNRWNPLSLTFHNNLMWFLAFGSVVCLGPVLAGFRDGYPIAGLTFLVPAAMFAVGAYCAYDKNPGRPKR